MYLVINNIFLQLMKNNTGRDFEKLTESLFDKLKILGDSYTIKHNVYLDGPDGKRQFDVILKHTVAGFDFTTAIECKDFKSKVSIKEIDNFESKLKDVNVQKGILVSRKGFSSKAISKAKSTNISLCTVHQSKSEKWEIDVDFKVFFCKIEPIEFRFSLGELRFAKGGSFLTLPNLKINDINIKNCFIDNWKNNNINIKLNSNIIRVILPEIRAPFFMEITNASGGKEKRELNEFYIELKYTRKFYCKYIEDIENTQILKNISENKMHVFIEDLSLTELSEDDFKIDYKTFKENTGYSLFVLQRPKDIIFKNTRFNLQKINTK